MNLVIDSSVAIKWFVAETLQAEAESLLTSSHRRVAPDLFIPEFLNALWKKTIRKEIEIGQARLISRQIVMPIYIERFVDSAALRERALELALAWNHPVYDCFYAACAEAIDGTLVSADDRLLRVLTRHDSAIRRVALSDAAGIGA